MKKWYKEELREQILGLIEEIKEDIAFIENDFNITKGSVLEDKDWEQVNDIAYYIHSKINKMYGFKKPVKRKFHL